jgi:hypothetical protein
MFSNRKQVAFIHVGTQVNKRWLPGRVKPWSKMPAKHSASKWTCTMRALNCAMKDERFHVDYCIPASFLLSYRRFDMVCTCWQIRYKGFSSEASGVSLKPVMLLYPKNC